MSEDDALTYIEAKMQEMKKYKVLFFIHGYNAEMEGNICTIYKMNKKLPNYLIIPVMWNTDRGDWLYTGDYYYDRDVTAPRAGNSLAALYETSLSLINAPKTWVCHSMGCFVTQFFAQDVYESSSGFSGEKIQDLFMVAPDVRYDLFNEWPLGSGHGKNECYDGQWNDPDESKRIPDCRLGGGEALMNMVNGMVYVFWSRNDMAMGWKETRLFNFRGWPISDKGLGGYGDNTSIGGRAPAGLASDCNKVQFIDASAKFLGSSDEHSYQGYDQMFPYYQAPRGPCDGVTGTTTVRT